MHIMMEACHAHSVGAGKHRTHGGVGCSGQAASYEYCRSNVVTLQPELLLLYSW